MPLRYALLLAFLPATVSAQAPTWSALPNSPVATYRFEDLEAVTPLDLYITNTDDEIYRSTDGGESWTLVYDDNNDHFFRSLGFVSPTHGWVGTLGFGTGGHVLFETTDGGETLTPVTDRITGPVPLAICGIYVLDDEAVYATGGISGGAYFLRTLDAGQTWTSTDLGAYAFAFVDVLFLDRQRGFLVGGDDDPDGPVVVMGTEDGGLTWTERYRGGTMQESGWKLSFPSPDVGYASVETIGTGGTLLKTTDGGQTWQALTVPVPDMQGVGFMDEQTGWIGGRSTPQVTTDGGATWSPDLSLGDTVNRFAFFGDTLAYAVAERVYRYGGAPVVNEPTAPDAPAFWIGDAYPNPFPERVLIPYRLPAPAEVTLEVFDTTGRRVTLVRHGRRPAGPDELLWAARDDAGHVLPAGVYLYRLTAGEATAAGRLVKLSVAR